MNLGTIQLDKYKNVIESTTRGSTKGLPAYRVNVNGCWIPKDIKPRTNGYFEITRLHNRKKYRVILHTLSYFLSIGFSNASSESMVCHREICEGYRGCFNPDHLYLGDAISNAKDRELFGVHQRGESNTRAKLTATDVREILALLDAGCKQTTIASKFDVSNVQISHIKRGAKWKHISRAKRLDKK